MRSYVDVLFLFDSVNHNFPGFTGTSRRGLDIMNQRALSKRSTYLVDGSDKVGTGISSCIYLSDFV